MRFAGRVVPRVTSTSFGIWNSGKTTIHGRDIVEKDPLRLELSGEGEILRVTVESETRSVNGPTASLTAPNRAILEFDYLDPGDGFRVQVLHSGAPKSIAAQGTIRGLPRGVEPHVPGRTFDLIMSVVLVVALVFAVATLGYVFLGIAVALWKEEWWQGLLFGAGIVAFIAFVVWSSGRPLVPPQAPKIRGVPRAISEDPTLSPPPLVVDSSQGRVVISRESLDRANHIPR